MRDADFAPYGGFTTREAAHGWSGTMKAPESIAAEVASGLSFSSNRMLNGRLVGEQYFAADAIARAIESDRLQMAGSITMREIRNHAGPGRLGAGAILSAVNRILAERARPAPDPQ